MVGLLHFSTDPDRAYKCRDELWAYLDPVIEERRCSPQGDVISQLIHDEVDGVKMDDALLKSHIGIMFSAGSSTTHDSIGNLLYGLLCTNDNWQQVRDNTALWDGAIDEALRWEPAVSFLPRVSREGEAIEIEGTVVPPDSFVFMGIAAANHDPVLCDRPHDFNIYREGTKSMTFGHGPRMCPGMHLARMNLRLTLEALIDRLPNLQLIDETVSRPCGTIFRHPEELRCRF